jgi:hypothetical protein
VSGGDGDAGPYLRAICRLRWGNQQRGRADADLCDSVRHTR